MSEYVYFKTKEKMLGWVPKSGNMGGVQYIVFKTF